MLCLEYVPLKRLQARVQLISSKRSLVYEYGILCFGSHNSKHQEMVQYCNADKIVSALQAGKGVPSGQPELGSSQDDLQDPLLCSLPFRKWHQARKNSKLSPFFCPNTMQLPKPPPIQCETLHSEFPHPGGNLNPGCLTLSLILYSVHYAGPHTTLMLNACIFGSSRSIIFLHPSILYNGASLVTAKVWSLNISLLRPENCCCFITEMNKYTVRGRKHEYLLFCFIQKQLQYIVTKCTTVF